MKLNAGNPLLFSEINKQKLNPRFLKFQSTFLKLTAVVLFYDRNNCPLDWSLISTSFGAFENAV